MRSLITYGFLQQTDNENSSCLDGPEVIPSIVEKIIIPWFSKMLQVSFNAYSGEEISNILRTLSDFEEFVLPSNPTLIVSLFFSFHFKIPEVLNY